MTFVRALNPQVSKKHALYSQPKVVIFCRKELLANNPDYQVSFLPIESLNDHKDEPIEAVEYFDQVEIGLFDEGKFKEYVQVSARTGLVWQHQR